MTSQGPRKTDDSPPPPYTITDESVIGSSSYARPEGPSAILVTPPSPDAHSARPISPFQFPGQASPPLHGSFGPTPLQQAQPLLLPYYDPRSPYSLAQADNRARTRFVAAVLWTIVLCVVASVVCVVWTQGTRVDWDTNWPGNGGSHAGHRHGQMPTRISM